MAATISSDPASNKRPRSPTSDPAQPAAKVPRVHGSSLQINYLARQNNDTIPLVTVKQPLPELLRLIGEYDGVLQRHESMAGNLGACPLGPILLKRFERLFDGPPRILKSHAKDANVTWLDVVDFAQNKPEQFNLEKMRNGIRVCQFYTKQCRVEISEEDFVLIHSGMPQKLIPPQPIEEDEEKELGVMELLDRNLGQVIQLADQVSARARQLIHKMKNRRAAILARRETEVAERGRATVVIHDAPASPTEANGSNARPAPSVETSQSPPTGFTAVNVRQSMAEAERRINDINRIVAPRSEDLFPASDTHNVTYINGRSVKGASEAERAEMLKKFMSPGDQDPISRSSIGPGPTQPVPGAPDSRPRAESLDYMGNKATSTVAIPNTPASLMPQVKSPFLERDDGGPFKSEMVTRMESMSRGDRIVPPCDRCRRLHMDCLKNLTACMGCTKKHAKCSWKDVRQDELKWKNKSADGAEAEQDTSQGNTSTPPPPPPPPPPPQTVAEVTRAVEESSRPPAEPEMPSEANQGQYRPNDVVTPDRASPPKQPSPKPPEPETSQPPPPAPPAPPERPPSTSQFDVRPPPLANQSQDAANKMSPPHVPQYPTYPPRDVPRPVEHEDNDEGDRLQALAAQVYRSASQSVKPQEAS